MPKILKEKNKPEENENKMLTITSEWSKISESESLHIDCLVFAPNLLQNALGYILDFEIVPII